MQKDKLLLIFLSVFVSMVTALIVSFFITKSMANVRFIPAPREDNEDFGYLEVKGNRYYQLYTTTQEDIGNGLHIHRIDLRGNSD